jgi:spoIIIJ-associated protein
MAQEEHRERTEDAPAGELNPETGNGAAPPTPAQPPDEPTLIRQTMHQLLRYMGFRVRVDIERTDEGWYADIRTRRSGAILIGHHGATLRAIQHVTSVIVRKHYPDLPVITVDVDGYRQRHETYLRRKAVAIATLVLNTGREMALDTLTEKEMHIVRDELKAMRGVRVHDVGDGPRRNVIVSPTGDARS